MCLSKYIGVERVADGLLLSSRRIGFDAGLVEQSYAIATTGFAFGRQVKPPRIVCAKQKYYPLGKKKSDPVMRPAVFCNAFVSAEGKKAIVLVNATSKPQSVLLYKGGARVSLELAGDEIRLLK